MFVTSSELSIEAGQGQSTKSQPWIHVLCPKRGVVSFGVLELLNRAAE